MTSNNSNDPDRSDWSNGEEECNPFVAFRRFADDQLNAVFQGLSELPAALSDLKQRVEDAEAVALRSFNRSYERATNPERRQTDTRGTGYTNGSGAEEEPRVAAVWDRFSRDGSGLRADPSIRSASGAEDYAGAWSRALKNTNGGEHNCEEMETSRRPFELDPLSLFHNPFSWRPSMRYLAGSRYSPLRLERDHTNMNWRDAFEDLLVEDASGQLPNPRRNVAQDQSENSDMWISSLVSRDLIELPIGYSMFSPLLSSPILALLSPFMESGREHDEESELDHYEQSLGKQEQSSQSVSSEPSANGNDESSRQIRTTSMPSIVATMTTTERHVLPDGTVTTKTVMKKRFADGREESEENMTTTHPTADLNDRVKETREDGPERPIAQAIKKDNWFWST